MSITGSSSGDAEAEDAAAEIPPELRLDVRRDGPVAEAPRGEPGLEVPADETMERRLLGSPVLVVFRTPLPPRTGRGAGSRPRCAGRDHEPIRRRESSR